MDALSDGLHPWLPPLEPNAPNTLGQLLYENRPAQFGDKLNDEFQDLHP